MIVRLSGGAGNTLFQYAFGRGLAAKTGKPVQFSFTGSTHLEPLRLLPNIQTNLVKWNPKLAVKERSFSFDPTIYDVPENSYLDGIWQSEKYFDFIADDIRRDLMTSHQVPERSCNAVLIHVRRGDYIRKEGFHTNLSKTDYYQRAVDYIRTQVTDPEFFIVSDEPDWCRQNMPYEVLTRDNIHHEDFFLMAGFRHSIIANSTYSWWGAWLGNMDTVVAPKQWFAQDGGDWPDTKDLIPSRWVRI